MIRFEDIWRLTQKIKRLLSWENSGGRALLKNVLSAIIQHNILDLQGIIIDCHQEISQPTTIYNASLASIAYRNYPLNETMGTIRSEWHESTPSKETTRPAQTNLQSTKNWPIT